MPHDTEGSPASAAHLRVVMAATAVAGAVAAVVVAHLGYTLAYNDARARLVVARRVFDSLTPGYEQLGGIWLPLPHLLNLPLVQSDTLYRTGYGMVAINVAAFAVLAGATWRIVAHLTGRPRAGLAAAGLIVLHPDLLYLQATPMTEVFTLALISSAIVLLLDPASGVRGYWAAGVLLALAMLTRYEAWVVSAGIVLLMAAASRPHGGMGAWRSHPVTPVATMFVVAIGGAAVWTRFVTGSWIVATDFFPQTIIAGRPLLAVGEVGRIALQAAGPGLLILAVVGVSWAAVQARRPGRRSLLLAATPMAAALLYVVIAHAGHSVLNRFAVFLLVPAVWYGVTGAAVLRDAGRPRLRAGLLALVIAWQAGVWIVPPVVREAGADVRRRAPFASVFDALATMRGEERVLASMWTSASLLHELSARGIPLRRVVHEGNGELFRIALARPADHVAWILVTCLAEYKDQVARSVASSMDAPATFDVAARVKELELYRVRPSHEASAPPAVCSGSD